MKLYLKTNLIFCLILVCSSQAIAQKGIPDSLITKMCDCITKSKKAMTNQEDVQLLVMECMLEGAGDNAMEMFEALGIDGNDEGAAQKFGQALGMQLVTKCPKFLELMAPVINKKTKTEAGTSDEAAGTSEGNFLKLELDGYQFLVIEAAGKQSKFLWLRQFPNSLTLPELLATKKGNKVTVSWKNIEVYVPKMKEYIRFREITALNW